MAARNAEGATARNALLTGATGFVGSHLARRLVADGWKVHAIVRPGADAAAIGAPGRHIVLHRHDGSTEGLLAILESSRPMVVFHLASLFLARHEPGDVEPLIRSNVLFGTQLVEAMTAAGAHRLVNAGTSWQHYEGRGYSPVCLYAATKQAFEAMLAFYTETTPLRAITLKLFDTYGPDDRRRKLFDLLRKAARDRIPLPMSPGEQRIDLVYIDDVVEAFLVAAGRLLSGTVGAPESYAVTSGNPVTLQKLVEIYGRVTGAPVPVLWGERPYRPREVMVPWCGGTVLPGWKPRVGLEEGIRRTG